jgi:hypothetical protein
VKSLHGDHWYLADLVVQFDIQGDSEYLYHVNTVLIKASSVEEALTKAEVIGVRSNLDYVNTDNAKVKARFLGLRNIVELLEPLEDGSELYYDEIYRPRNVSQDDLVKERTELISPKSLSGN